MLPYGKHKISSQDIDAVVQALKSDFITQGPLIQKFEDTVSSYCGSKFAVAFSSGTAALHAAYAVVGLESQDEIITSPISFVATSNAALFLGATPLFSDINKETAQIDVHAIERKITKNTKIIVPVDLCGEPSDIKPIVDLAKSENILVVRDAAHSFGASYEINNQTHKVGSCSHEDLCCFSFHPVKSFTTGEGGMVTTNSQEFYEKLIAFRQHGITKNQSELKNKELAKNPWYYEMQSLGMNYRITDFQCALGINQLSTLDSNIKNRHNLAERYRNQFSGILSFLHHNESNQSANHIFPVFVEEHKRDQLMIDLKTNEIGTQLHYYPIYRQPYYQSLFDLDPTEFPNAEHYWKTAITIPLYADLKESEQDFVCETLINLINA